MTVAAVPAWRRRGGRPARVALALAVVVHLVVLYAPRAPAPPGPVWLDKVVHVTIDMLLRAAKAIADTVSAEELHPAFIIPSVFHPDVTKRVASAISGREG